MGRLSPEERDGALYGIELLDILQMLHYARRSLTVRPDEDATIHLRDGQIVHAETAELRGEEALGALLGRPLGTVRTTEPLTCATTIDRGFDELLLGLLRQIDEQRAGRTSDRANEAEAHFGTDQPLTGATDLTLPTSVEVPNISAGLAPLSSDPSLPSALHRSPSQSAIVAPGHSDRRLGTIVALGIAVALLVPATLLAVYAAIVVRPQEASEDHWPVVVPPHRAGPDGLARSGTALESPATGSARAVAAPNSPSGGRGAFARAPSEAPSETATVAVGSKQEHGSRAAPLTRRRAPTARPRPAGSAASVSHERQVADAGADLAREETTAPPGVGSDGEVDTADALRHQVLDEPEPVLPTVD